MLKGHVNLPAGIKETDFFTTNYSKGIEWHAHHFRNADGSRPIGEINPYFGFRELASPSCSELLLQPPLASDVANTSTSASAAAWRNFMDAVYQKAKGRNSVWPFALLIMF